MHVKKYEAKNMKEALDMVKADLGPDAIILSAKDNSKKYGLVGEGSVEVTAAISEGLLRRKQFTEQRLPDVKKELLRKIPAKSQKEVINRVVNSYHQDQERQNKQNIPATKTTSNTNNRRYIDIEDEESELSFAGDDQFLNHGSAKERIKNAAQRALDAMQFDHLNLFTNINNQRDTFQISNSASASNSSSASASTSASASNSNSIFKFNSNSRPSSVSGVGFNSDNSLDFASEGGSSYQNSSDVHTSQRVESIQQDNAHDSLLPAQLNPEVSSLQKEIHDLRKIIDNFKNIPQTFSNSYPGSDYGLTFELSFMFEKMQKAGIQFDYIADLLHQVQSGLPPHQLKKRALVEGYVARLFLNEIKIEEYNESKNIQVFVGASGHGKTATLVKFAAHIAIREKKRVAILSTDTLKVGASDQLKIYAQILNIPFLLIRKFEDWEILKPQLSEFDQILVDTPGFGLRSQSEFAYIKKLLPPIDFNPLIHLVLSATAKDQDAIEIGKRFENINYKDVIFTALDESTQHGVIYNFQKYFNKPIHSFGTGANIPEDFERATKERILDLIFQISNHGFKSA